MVVWHVTTEIMLVIIYLLEDEQELSLGMLIRPKRIYNFCLLHACFVRLCHVLLELSYTFDHIWTNLLTQCTQLSVPIFCYFCISGFPDIQSAPKIPDFFYKNQCHGSFRNNQEMAGGPPPWAHVGFWRGSPLGCARDPSGVLVAPLGAPLAYIYPQRRKPLISISYSRSPLCTAAAVSRSGLPGEAAPAPCWKEEPPPGDHPLPWTPPGCSVSSPSWNMGP